MILDLLLLIFAVMGFVTIALYFFTGDRRINAKREYEIPNLGNVNFDTPQEKFPYISSKMRRNIFRTDGDKVIIEVPLSNTPYKVMPPDIEEFHTKRGRQMGYNVDCLGRYWITKETADRLGLKYIPSGRFSV